ncbi:MAG: type 4a pilus biogenesis protein PilO [Minisyncoccia bacterium]
MFKTISAIIIAVLAVLLYVFFTNEQYQSLKDLQVKQVSLNEALDNAKQYRELGAGLTTKYQSIDQTQISRLKTLVPDSVETVRLIKDVSEIISVSGMTLKKVDYNPEQLTKKQEATVGAPVNTNPADLMPYGSYVIRFSMTGTYQNFVTFLQAIERSLRLLDVTAVSFGTPADRADSKNPSDIYEYSITVQTYWLKN